MAFSIFGCSSFFPEERKTISGRVIDNVSKTGISQITISIIEYKSKFMSMGGHKLGEAAKTHSDSNGYFSSTFTPNEDANQWLLSFSSIDQEGSSPWYRDIAWYEKENDVYELSNQQ